VTAVAFLRGTPAQGGEIAEGSEAGEGLPRFMPEGSRPPPAARLRGQSLSLGSWALSGKPETAEKGHELSKF